MADRTVTQKRRQRLREVEELYLNFYCAKEIHDILGEKWDVTHGTIKNDIVTIRKWHKAAVEEKDVDSGRQGYVARLKSIRRRAATGFKEPTGIKGDVRIKGRDMRLVHDIDKEIARMEGVELKSDSRTIHVDLEKARNFIKEIMEIVMRRVIDREIQIAIIDDIEKLADGRQ